ncbi:MAG: aminotransferase class I/II-fold pyridoxal phosphate-dependent enzyme, partial [Deltaproteobacteria bacterium]|nr:aminotransferase class I/II-fold pyridoxal phosphate-dependent enzyme [Deltaproteobacteria bacterium]
EATGVPIERILAGNGSDELLALIVRATIEPGDAIAYPEPTYVLYETLAAAQGARVLTTPFDAAFTLPESLATLPARVFFVASPNSPSGNSHPAAALERLARARPDALVVVDEAYADFADGDALGLVGRLPNLVVLRTFSKSYALAGMRIGLLFGPEALVAGIGKIKDSYNLDRLALRAGAAALRDGAHMRAGVARIRATRARLVAGLASLGYRVLPSDANFVFARAEPGRARSDVARLKGAGILVRYFDRPGLDDGMRVTVGTDEEIDLLLAALGRG